MAIKNHIPLVIKTPTSGLILGKACVSFMLTGYIIWVNVSDGSDKMGFAAADKKIEKARSLKCSVEPELYVMETYNMFHGPGGLAVCIVNLFTWRGDPEFNCQYTKNIGI